MYLNSLCMTMHGREAIYKLCPIGYIYIICLATCVHKYPKDNSLFNFFDTLPLLVFTPPIRCDKVIYPRLFGAQFVALVQQGCLQPFGHGGGHFHLFSTLCHRYPQNNSIFKFFHIQMENKSVTKIHFLSSLFWASLGTLHCCFYIPHGFIVALMLLYLHPPWGQWRPFASVLQYVVHIYPKDI